MADPTESAPATVDEIAASLQELQTKVTSAIDALEVNVDEIDFLGSELVAFEETEHFQGITEHSHQQIVLDCREYIGNLREGLERLKEKLADVKDSQQSALDITCQELSEEVDRVESYQEGTK